MINDNFQIPKEEAKIYPNLPENVYPVEILDINVEKTATFETKMLSDDKKVYENTLNFQFTILEGRDEAQEKEEHKELRGRNIWKNFIKTSLFLGKNGKNVLWKIIEATIGRELTKEEEMTFDSSKLNGLIGQQLKVFIENKVNKNDSTKVYDNPIKFMKIEVNKTPLNDEEKENSRVKKDDEKPASHSDQDIARQNEAPQPVMEDSNTGTPMPTPIF